MNPWLTGALTLSSGLIVAVVSSLLTVRLALRRFYSEKWWERKAAAYTAIMESMHHVREHADTHLAFELNGRELPADGKDKLDRELRQAVADLRRHRDVGSLVISAEATAALNELFQELEKSAQIGHERSFFEYLDYRVGALDRSLQNMRRMARQDLSLRASLPQRLARRLLAYFSQTHQ